MSLSCCWNAAIRWCSDSGEYELAVWLYRRMKVQPDRFTFPPLLKSCARLRALFVGRQAHCAAAVNGIVSDTYVSNSLIALYGRCHRLEDARKLFDKMPHRNIVSWSSMIRACAENGSSKLGLALFKEMCANGIIRPNRPVLLNVIPCISGEDEADKLHKLAIEERLDLDKVVQNAMIVMYSNCRRADLARKVFNGIAEKDVVSWSTMIEAHAHVGMLDEALRVYKRMRASGIVSDNVTVLGILRACSNTVWSSSRHARFIHGLIVKSSLGRNLMVETAIIDAYVKVGALSLARVVFDQMKERSLISWSTMISGYGLHGKGKDAIALFNHMTDTLKPDHIVFVALLSACSHSGLIDEGWKYFNSMTSEFGIFPTNDHFSCMVDLLGRSGKLEEAHDFIQRMPINPNSSVWGSLLGACRVHSNLQIAELAAESLLELDPSNSGRYICLANIYTSMGKIEDAVKIRALMKERRVRKTPGFTYIEVKYKVHKFKVGDRSHRQCERIYEELDRLMDRIRKEGYVPDTKFALHDIEEETKEMSLYVHSEKLAIVFGLLNLELGSEIRIHKNLRVCGDCHTATKLISKVTGRRIVARDSHRFHHFYNGECSCGDYW